MTPRTIIEAFLVLTALVAIWYSNLPQKAPVGQYQVPQKAPELKLVPTEQLTCKPITVYIPIAKKEVQLPPDIQADKDKFVLDATTINSARHPQELVTIFDDKTGKTQSLIREQAYPWIQALQTGYVGVGYGYTGFQGQRGYQFFAHEDLLAIKAIRFGVDAALYTGGTTFLGVSGSYGW